MFPVQYFSGSPRHQVIVPGPQLIYSSSFAMTSSPQSSPKYFNYFSGKQQAQQSAHVQSHSLQSNKNDKSINQLTQKVHELQNKLSNVCLKMKKLENEKQFRKVKQPSVLVSPLKESNLNVTKKEQDFILVYSEKSTSMVQSDELKLIESKISIFNKRKEFLERSITRKFKSDTAPSEANLSILSINKLKTEVQFTCTYNENGEIIYEGEIREGQYNGKGHLMNTLYRNSNVNAFSCIQDFCLNHESDFWTSYDGQFKDGLFHGPGSLYLQYVYKINANFENGMAEGRITLIDIQKQNSVFQHFQRSQVLLIGRCKEGYLEKIYVTNVKNL